MNPSHPVTIGGPAAGAYAGVGTSDPRAPGRTTGEVVHPGARAVAIFRKAEWDFTPRPIAAPSSPYARFGSRTLPVRARPMSRPRRWRCSAPCNSGHVARLPDGYVIE